MMMGKLSAREQAQYLQSKKRTAIRSRVKGNQWPSTDGKLLASRKANPFYQLAILLANSKDKEVNPVVTYSSTTGVRSNRDRAGAQKYDIGKLIGAYERMVGWKFTGY